MPCRVRWQTDVPVLIRVVPAVAPPLPLTQAVHAARLGSAGFLLLPEVERPLPASG